MLNQHLFVDSFFFLKFRYVFLKWLVLNKLFLISQDNSNKIIIYQLFVSSLVLTSYFFLHLRATQTVKYNML